MHVNRATQRKRGKEEQHECKEGHLGIFTNICTREAKINTSQGSVCMKEGIDDSL